jgi:hypothetical protein
MELFQLDYYRLFLYKIKQKALEKKHFHAAETGQLGSKNFVLDRFIATRLELHK